MSSSGDSGAGWSAVALVERTRLPLAELARFLRLTAPVFDRRLRQDSFTRTDRVKLHRLSTVLDRAQRVLGDRGRAADWLNSANRALAFSSPIALIETRTGAERVYGVLSRMEGGHFA